MKGSDIHLLHDSLCQLWRPVNVPPPLHYPSLLRRLQDEFGRSGREEEQLGLSQAGNRRWAGGRR